VPRGGLPELRVAYEVVELHPAVAADARAEASRRQAPWAERGNTWEIHGMKKGIPWDNILYIYIIYSIYI